MGFVRSTVGLVFFGSWNFRPVFIFGIEKVNSSLARLLRSGRDGRVCGKDVFGRFGSRVRFGSKLWLGLDFFGSRIILV
jgi:hypothetical protein